jgi:serine/threonine protein kinase
MPATERLPSTLGPYRLQDRLGEGGMGVVHLALDPEGRKVAVKVLQPLGSEGVNARRRLAREVETMRRVHSPFVAEVLDADVTGEYPYIVTRFVSGPTLDEMVRARGPLSGQGLRRLAYGMAEALTAIHAAGVVHRDLKPGNVMLTDDRPIVIDFGIAQVGDATRLTQTGLVMGTPGYLAPEVIEGQPSSFASDIHSWGSTMAFAATGQLPFGSGSYEQIFYRIVSGRADLTGVPAPMMPLITAALARDPSHRPSAAWLSAHAATLDMSAPGPSATSAYYPDTQTAIPAGAGAAGAGAAGAAAAAPRFTPMKTPKQSARDVADLLPPVDDRPAQARPGINSPNGTNSPNGANGQRGTNGQRGANGQPDANGQHQPQARYPGQPQAPYPGQPAPYSGQWPDPRGDATGRPAAGPAGTTGRPATARPATAAGLAVMVVAIALTVVLPVAGLAVSLAVITLLRAAERAQSTLAARRSARGPRPSDLIVVLIMAPLTVVRALLTEVLMAPLAVAAGAVVYGVTLAATHSLDMQRAGAYAAAAIVAWYGLGPGSGRPRRQVNRIAGVVARTPMSAVVTALVVWALAAAAVLFAVSQTPYYWPATAPHLPGLHGLISGSWSWLTRQLHLWNS